MSHKTSTSAQTSLSVSVSLDKSEVCVHSAVPWLTCSVRPILFSGVVLTGGSRLASDATRDTGLLRLVLGSWERITYSNQITFTNTRACGLKSRQWLHILFLSACVCASACVFAFVTYSAQCPACHWIFFNTSISHNKEQNLVVIINIWFMRPKYKDFKYSWVKIRVSHKMAITKVRKWVLLYKC